MRLGVNAMRPSGQRLGVGRYIESLTKYRGRMTTPGHRVAPYVRRPLMGGVSQLPGGFRVAVLGPALPGVLWKPLVPARGAREMGVLFCPSYTVPPSHRCRCVVADRGVNEATSGSYS